MYPGFTELINESLAIAVAMEYQKYKRLPELVETNRRKLTEWAHVIAEKGDTIMFRSAGSGENFVILAQAITFLAIVSPTGVNFNGRTYNFPMPE